MNADLADNCGNCLTTAGSAEVQPHRAGPDGNGGIRADYRCPRCGHRWFTTWSPDALGVPEAGAA